jgi:hypothetical protein
MQAGTSKYQKTQKKTLMGLLFLLFFVCSRPTFSQQPAGPALSNILPRSVLAEMMDAGFEILQLDDPSSLEHQEISRFWTELNRQPMDVEKIVDQLFGAEPRSFNNSERDLYSMKYLLLRDLVEKSPEGAYASLMAAWQSRYLKTSWILLTLCDFEELKAIARRFQERLAKKEVRLVDLSPKLRASHAEGRGNSHGVKLIERLPNSRRFQISGFFHAGSGVLAVDFSRSVEENLITLVHEIVHAADPEMDSYREEFKRLWPEVSKILAKLTPDPSKIVPIEAFDGSFERGEMSRIELVLNEARARKLKSLEAKVEKAELDKTEKETLRKWVRAAIGLTLENEYKAYAHSLVVYSRLRNRYHLFVDNLSMMKEFTERLIAGDRTFALRLSSDNNAMDRIQIFLRSSMHAQGEGERDLLQILEYFYLQELEEFLKNLVNRYSKEIAEDRALLERKHKILPQWARPGGWNLPSNPYQILSARLSLAWAVAFSKTLSRVHVELKEINEPLWLLHSGVLDLHDISIGELKLLGIHYTDSPYSRYPDELSEKLRSDVESLSAEMRSLFELYKFDANLSVAGQAISGMELRSKLVGLRLLRATSWIHDIELPLGNSVLGLNNFLSLLNSGLAVDPDLTTDRKKEIENELGDAVGYAQNVRDQFITLSWLAEKLGEFSYIAESANLAKLSETFKTESQNILRLLANHRVSTTPKFEPGAVPDRIKTARKDLLKLVLAKVGKSCKEQNSKRQLGFFPGSGPFTVEDYTFYAMVLCWEKQVYLVRQPGDFSKYMTTTFMQNRPVSRIFIGARPVELESIGTLDEFK